jgi:hypothetical protein
LSPAPRSTNRRVAKTDLLADVIQGERKDGREDAAGRKKDFCLRISGAAGLPGTIRSLKAPPRDLPHSSLTMGGALSRPASHPTHPVGCFLPGCNVTTASKWHGQSHAENTCIRPCRRHDWDECGVGCKDHRSPTSIGFSANDLAQNGPVWELAAILLMSKAAER